MRKLKQLLCGLLAMALLVCAPPAAMAEDAAAPGPAPCTQTEGCPQEAGHEGGCRLPAAPYAAAVYLNGERGSDDKTGTDAENAVKTANATRQALLPSADTFTEVAPETPTEGVTAIYKADNDSGYVITAQAKGYGGEVPVMVAFNAEGTIEAVQFLDNDETPGLGQKVKSEAFQSQFSGMPAEEFGLSDIDAITGATISSGAAASAINAAIAAYNQEAGVAGEDLSALSPEELRAALLPDAGAITPVDVSADGVTEAYKGEAYGVVIYAQAEGFYKKPVTAAVGFDDDGVITGVYIDASNETADVGGQVGRPRFAGQFVGKTSLDGVDAVAGATISSNAAMDAVQKAIDAFSTVKGA